MGPAMQGQSEQKLSRGNTGQYPPGAAPVGQPVPEQRPVPESGGQRLTPEERQQLRRDINAAGRDIYRRTRTE